MNTRDQGSGKNPLSYLYASGRDHRLADTLSDAWIYLKRMFAVDTESQILVHWMLYLSIEEMAVFAAAFICSFPIFRNLISAPAEAESDSQFADRQKIYQVIPANLWLIILFVLAVTRIATSTYNPFIYFRF